MCLYFQLGENSTCYEELPLTIDIPENVRAECTGREIVILNSTECDGDKEGNEGSILVTENNIVKQNIFKH